MAITPSVRRQVAPTGQTGVHGGFSHCMHGRGRKRRRTFGYVPTSSFTTGRYTTPGGSWFSALQAIVQASQPLHFRRSITITHLRSPTGFRIAATSSRCMRRRSLSPSRGGGSVGSAFGGGGGGVGEGGRGAGHAQEVAPRRAAGVEGRGRLDIHRLGAGDLRDRLQRDREG